MGLAAAGVGILGAAGAGWALDGTASGDGPSLGPGPATVEMNIHHSRFSVDRVHVERGTLLRFGVPNADPILHELVAGDEAVHARHASGTEASHPAVPGEVSVAPGEVGVTTLRFDQLGTFVFACHLPGHFRYGMHGEVVVS